MQLLSLGEVEREKIINQRNKDGESVLKWARRSGQEEIVKMIEGMGGKE